MPIITGPAGMDPILGEMRTIDISGSTGGGGDYTFNTSEFTVGITGLVSLNQVPGNKVSGTASVEDVQTGGAQRLVDVTALRGALTAGQAVDVTSQPDNVTGDYRGAFSVTGTLGFADFPKFASGLAYLMIADLTATSSGTVTPSGTWLDGTTSAKNLTAGTSTRVAMLFDADNKAKFTFANTGSVSVSNCREYEVTACSSDAVAYIAALSNPDNFDAYYLVKRDMVSPWTYIINMGESPSTTVAAGLAYQINALTGTHIITTDTCPVGYVGRDSFARIFVGQTGNVVVQSPLQLATPFVANAINNCHISYRDGAAVLTVDDTVGGYVVEEASGTTEGTLYYGLMDSSTEFISIPVAFDGIPVDLGGASVTTSGTAQKYVVGNGSNTLISGNVNAGTALNLSNLSLQDIGLTGGVMTLPNGVKVAPGTVVVSGGTLAISGGTVAGTVVVSGGTCIVSSAVVESGGTLTTPFSIANGGRIVLSSGGVLNLTSNVTLSNNNSCYISGGTATGTKQLMCPINGFMYFNGVSFFNSACPYVAQGGSADFVDIDCQNVSPAQTFDVAKEGKTAFSGCKLMYTRVLSGGTMTLHGSNHFGYRFMGSGTAKLYIESGATVDMTGNTWTNASYPAFWTASSGIIVAGGDSTKSCTIINSGGTSIPLSGGTYSTITNAGVVA